MRLSESLRKGIMESLPGSILHKFQVNPRRSVFFFEDIFANYIKECEAGGYRYELKEISERCSNLCSWRLMPNSLKIVPPKVIYNTFISKLWKSIGILDYLHLEKIDNEFRIHTKYESITRIIGPNNFMQGFYTGMLSSILKSKVVCTKALQNKKRCEYLFKVVSNKYCPFSAKEMHVYHKLNKLSNQKGIKLEDALKTGVFKLTSDNKIYFRGKILSPVENTLFHMIGNSKILFDKIPEISNKFFSSVITESSDAEKLRLIKNILEAMGWGIIRIASDNKEIVIRIDHPPYGLQRDPDNWDFLLKVIEGYIWLFDKSYRLSASSTKNKILTAIFVRI